MADSATYEKRYEQNVRLATVFFSALVGFALKKIFDGSDAGATSDSRLWCFISALLLNLRFLFGSANHLWIEYVHNPPATGRQSLSMLWDVFWLGTFGVLSLKISYSLNTAEFLIWNIVIGIAALIAAFADRCIRYLAFDRKPRGYWKGWICINSLHAGAAFICLNWPANLSHSTPPLQDTTNIWWFAAASFLLFLADLVHQLVALSSKGPNEPEIANKQFCEKVAAFLKRQPVPEQAPVNDPAKQV